MTETTAATVAAPVAGPSAPVRSHASSAPTPTGRALRALAAWALRIAALAILGVVTYFNYRYSTEEAEAERAYAANDLASAARWSSDRLTRRPPSPKAERILALSLARMGDSRLAEPHFERARPLEIADLRIRAFALVRADMFDEAIRVYEEILTRVPDEVESLRHLGAIYMRLSRWEDGFKVANRLIDLPKGKVTGYTLRGQIHSFINSDSPRSTIEAYEKVLELDPKLSECPLPHSLFRLTLAKAYLKTDTIPEAKKTLQEGLSETDKNGEPIRDAELMETLGEAYLQANETDEAVRCFERSIEWDPKRSGPWLELAKIEFSKGDDHLAKALELAQKAADLSPLAPDPFYQISRIYRRIGKEREAEKIERKIDRIRRSAAAKRQAEDGVNPQAGSDPREPDER